MLNGRGWWRPPAGSKFHFVGDDERALCGQWAYLQGQLLPEDGPSPDDCKACRRKVDAMKAKESTDG